MSADIQKCFEDFCIWLTSVYYGSMQGLQDILVASGHYISPVIKGLLDITAGIFPQGKNGNGKGKNGGGKSASQMKEGCSSSGAGAMVGFNRNVVRLAGVSGAMAVAFGAYGAHVVMTNPSVPDEQKISFRTANLYHFIGTGGIVAASLSRCPKMSALLMTTGSLLFCGSCYYHSFTGDEKVKKLAPVGGITLILAWLSLML